MTSGGAGGAGGSAAAAGAGGAASQTPGGSGGLGGTELPVSTPPASPDAGAGAEPAVHFVGRMDTRDAAGPRFAWSGAGVIANFSGTAVTVRLDDSGSNQFTVLLDGELAPTLVTVAGPSDYVLASGLDAGAHRVELYRRTEASFGPTQFLGFDFGADGALLPPPPVSRRIEIIGDSVSAGYGNEGVLPCAFSADTENHYLTYGAIAARALDAELSTVAWSGKGVVYNYDTDVNEPMPELYERTLPADPTSTYDFAIQPDVVLINLGTNDFSTEDDPSTELFADAYAALLTRVREEYPDALISCTVGPLLAGDDLTAARAGISAGVAAFTAAGGSNAIAWEMDVPNGNPPGCDYHPNLDTHQAMADAVAAEIESALGVE
jgi:lysophospholipase L1-like esterase